MLTALILTLVAVLLTSMLCSLTEATILSLNSVRLESLHRQGKKYARIWIELKKHIDRPISAVLIINTIANTGGATVIGFLYDKTFGPSYLWLFLIFFTITLLYFSEIIPKFLGSVYCEELAPLLARPLLWATIILDPALRITNALARKFKSKTTGDHLSSTDIEVLAQLARSHNIIALEQEQIIINAAKLRTLKVTEIMIPREWIVALDLDQPTAFNIQRAQHALHTRYPVAHGSDPDDITGYINFKDLVAFSAYEKTLNLEAFVRPILSIDGDISVNMALRQLTARRYHIALVRNLDERVIGLLTLEDILEELVGEIEDEFDASGGAVIQINEHTWRVGGNLTMDKVIGLLGVEGAVEGDGSITLSRWLDGKLGHNFHPGTSHLENGLSFTVQQARRGKIFQVLVRTGHTAVQT